MAEKRLRIQFPFFSDSEANWSHQVASCREIDIERLASEEWQRQPQERLDADEIAVLLADATGKHDQAYRYMVEKYVATFDEMVSSMLKVSLDLAPVDYEQTGDCEYTGDYFSFPRIFASIPEGKARELLKKSSRDRHRCFQDELAVSKTELRELLEKPLEDWSSNELGALLESQIEADDVASDVFRSMAEGSDCFFADSAINWKTYEAAAEELRQAKKSEWKRERGDYTLTVPRSIRFAPPSREVEHPCAGLSIVEVAAFDAIASGNGPTYARNALGQLVRLGYLNETGWPKYPDDEAEQLAVHRYKIPVSLYIQWCQWIVQQAKRGVSLSETAGASTESSGQLSLFSW
jgi:hypothetical protein